MSNRQTTMEQSRGKSGANKVKAVSSGLKRMIVFSLVYTGSASFLAHTNLWEKVVYAMLNYLFGEEIAKIVNGIIAFSTLAVPAAVIYFLNTLEEE